MIVENGVSDGKGGWLKDAAGVYLKNPATVDAAAKKIADKYRTAVAPLANRVVGSITADITRTGTAAGESPLGDVIADAELARTGAQIAIMNPGGIRADFAYAASAGGEGARSDHLRRGVHRPAVQQPGGHRDAYPAPSSRTSWSSSSPGTRARPRRKILQVSAGLTYTWSASAPLGSKISALALNGTPIDPAASYQVSMNDFLANGGDGFTGLTAGTGRTTAPGFDIDALVAYLGAGTPGRPPGPVNRITTVA